MDEAKRQAFLRSLAETVLEVDPNGFAEASILDPWDSLAWVSTMALVDEHFGVSVNPRALKDCKTAGDVLLLVTV